MQIRSGKLPPELLDSAVELMGRAGRGGALRVVGSSMEPMLQAGRLLGAEFAPTRLRPGDLLLFRQADYLVVHRLLGRGRAIEGRRCYRTRGDNSAALDPPVEAARVLGRVVAVEVPGGWVSVRDRPARAYAWLVARQALVGAAAAALAARGDRLVARCGLRVGFRPAVVALDRWLLRATHRLLFHRAHGATAPPAELPPARPAGEG